MNDEFYAVVKLVTEEEILGYISVEKTGIVIKDPLRIEDLSLFDDLIEGNLHSKSFKLSKWIKSSTDNKFLILDRNIVTIGELQEPMLSFYKKTLRDIINGDNLNNLEVQNNTKRKPSRRDGYRSNGNGSIKNVKEARNLFERLFKDY